MAFYFLNRILIRLFDSRELQEVKRSVVAALLDAASRREEVYANPTNLTEETAWIDLEKYWSVK
jgi:hypothetical protein